MRLIIVSGLSGSGKTIALHTLEDLGFYCIDNMPVSLLDALAQHLVREPDPRYQQTAVGIDARNLRASLKEVPALTARLREQGIGCEIVFIEAENDTLIERFSETRRRHPLSDQDRPLAEALSLERMLLAPLSDAAALRIDTTGTNVHELRDLIRTRFGEPSGVSASILFQSFGFKKGIPRDADFVFDVRCLPNPHWHHELRPLTGRDRPVIEFLEADADVIEMRDELITLLERWIPRFEADGRSYLTIAVGCTGGHHRSVYITEQLRRHFSAQGRRVLCRHRELP